MLQLPEAPSRNEAALSRVERERVTGLVTAALPLSVAAVEGLELVFKNGALLDPNGGAGGYSILGKDITLGAAAIAGDVFVIWYYARGI